jgi:ERCC4-type nuclease
MNWDKSVKLVIDHREHDIISYCKEKSIAFSTCSLDVGDLLLTNEVANKPKADENQPDVSQPEVSQPDVSQPDVSQPEVSQPEVSQIEATQPLKLVFERKTIADLAASIKDGRYREQKQRLKSTFPFHRITYIIEGSISVSDINNDKSVHGINSKAIVSSLLSSRYRDGFQVIHTADVKETMWYICELAERFSTPDKLLFDTEHGSYTASVKVKSKKSDNVTKEVAYRMQLSQIPGLSMKIADDIANMYPSFRQLLDAIDEKGVKAFEKVAGMGKARSKKIIEFIDF